MSYYIGLSGGRTATFDLHDEDGHTLAAVDGRLSGHQPRSVIPASATGPGPYPHYEVVTVNGITEVIEHRKPGPRFHITDDPEVKRILNVPER